MTQVPVRAHPNDDAFDIIANKARPAAVRINNRPNDAEEMSLCRHHITIAVCRRA